MSNTTEINSTSSYVSETPPIYVNPDSMSDPNNVRLRYMKLNVPIKAKSEPVHLILTNDDFPINEKDNNNPHILSSKKHKKRQLILIIFMVLSYVLHTLRFYIPEHIQTSSDFWSSIKPLPITRVYTSDFRPNLFIENLLLRSVEICQTLWLIYILSFIPRRTHLGYLYRNPNLFHSLLCSLLITAISFQTISQTFVSLEISCACLFISLILLIISCRLITIKLLQYEEKFKKIDFIIIRYFVLNSLFLYTTSIAYLTICSSIECLAFYFDPNVQYLSLITTISLSILLICLGIYYFLDQFIYENEFRSIWMPYIFLGIIFHCPSLRKLFSNETIFDTDERNFYFLWIIFITIIILILIRIGRQIFIKYREIKRKLYRIPFTEQKSLETENQ